MERDAIARNGRRDQALDALAFEREREDALRAQIAQIVLERDGPRIDERAFAQMSAGDVQLVREMLGDVDEPLDDIDAELLTLADDDDAGEEEEEPEAEIERLEGEIEQCLTRQRAIESYVAALDAEGAPG
jgi:hypothetical protein